jgi:hypothetical protein
VLVPEVLVAGVLLQAAKATAAAVLPPARIMLRRDRSSSGVMILLEKRVRG